MAPRFSPAANRAGAADHRRRGWYAPAVTEEAAHRHVVSGGGGVTVAGAARAAVPGASWNRARDLVRSGRVTVDGAEAQDPAARLPVGAVVEVRPRAPRRRAGLLPRESFVHVDGDVAVVHKPAGLLTVPYGPTDRDTLVDQAAAALRRREGRRVELGVVQRLDRDTSGLLVFARNLRAKRHLQAQLRAHTVERRYVALVDGAARAGRHESWLVANRGDGLRGSWGVFRRPRGKRPAEARRAVTHVTVLERFDLGGGRAATRVECRLETGRQHQIRIHLAEAGTPLLGERVYVRDRAAAPAVEAPRVMLHAGVLGFEHPRGKGTVRFEAAPPDDLAGVLDLLRSRASSG